MELSGQNHNKLKTAGIALTAVLGLTACSGSETTHLNNEKYSPVERFNYDYAAGRVGCLAYTAYDPFSDTAPTAIFDKGKKQLTITPVNGVSSLHVTGFDQNLERVSPVNPEDQAILDSYGCDTGEY